MTDGWSQLVCGKQWVLDPKTDDKTDVNRLFIHLQNKVYDFEARSRKGSKAERQSRKVDKENLKG